LRKSSNLKASQKMTSFRSGVKMGLMKKLPLYIFLVLMFCNVGFAETVKLKCRGILDTIEEDIVYVTFDDHKIEVFQGSGGNKVEFKVKIKNEQWVISHLRSVLKGDTSYDTHVSDWEHWDFVEYKRHLYQIQIDRLDGFVHIMRSVKPWKDGKKEYDLVNAGEGIGKLCKKSGSKF